MAKFQPSPHKEEALTALAGGESPEDVAARLGITVRTAYRYKNQLESLASEPQTAEEPDVETGAEPGEPEGDIPPKPVVSPAKAKKPESKSEAAKSTTNLAEAATIRFTPKVYAATYTPIMMQAQDAAVKYLGWRRNMPFENFIDTVLFLAFQSWGITLGGYIVDESLLGHNGNGDGLNGVEVAGGAIDGAG